MTPGVTLDATFVWEGRTIRLSYTPRKFDEIDHVEITSENRDPLPITETGYLSHFFGPMEPMLTLNEIVDAVHDQLEERAKEKAWRDAESRRRQPSLF